MAGCDLYAVEQGRLLCDTMAVIILAIHCHRGSHEHHYRHHQRSDLQPSDSHLHEGRAECSPVRVLCPCGAGVDELQSEICVCGYSAESGYPCRTAQVRQLADLPAAVGQG